MTNPSKHHLGRWWSSTKDGRFKCELCPRECTLKSGQRGFCFVREATDDEIILTTYGRSSGFCVDPIEKKPLNHFYPGSSVLSFGTAGCNLACKFCQNWDISKAKTMDRLMDQASPNLIAKAAKELKTKSVAFTYNDPVIFAEYAIDTAIACHELDIKTVAVSAGYIGEKAREDFFEHIDAANIDLKAFSEEFYLKHSSVHLNPVLETLEYIAKKTKTWLEITTLLIPGENDSDQEVQQMTQWIVEKLGPHVPLHFSAFHPDFKMKDKSATPPETLFRARKIAMDNGLRYVYTGNVHDAEGGSTYCPSCKACVIERDWYQLGNYQIKNGSCTHCGTSIAGHFDDHPGTWGQRRLPVNLKDFDEDWVSGI